MKEERILKIAEKYKAGDALHTILSGVPPDAVSRSPEMHALLGAATDDLDQILPGLAKLPLEGRATVLASILGGVYWQGYQRGKAANLVFHVAQEEVNGDTEVEGDEPGGTLPGVQDD